jgi:hypothetical protein
MGDTQFIGATAHVAGYFAVTDTAPTFFEKA